jgi:transcriptional regulator with XRE-family HTH domain
MAQKARHHLPPAIDTADMAPKELTKQEFGRRLMALMLDKGWNQSELARAAELGRDAISTYIRGVSFPEPKNLRKLANALDVQADQLLPNVVVRAMDSDANPMLEIKQAQGHPDKVWLRVNRMTSFTTAGRIFSILQEDETTQ